MKRKKLFIIFFCVILIIAFVVRITFRPHNQGLYEVTILATFEGANVLPLAINDNGQIAGFLDFQNGTNHLFIWDKVNGIRDLGAVDGRVFLNNAGQIASNFQDPNGNTCAFLWDPNAGRTILPALGGNYSSAYGINDYGQVAGSAKTPGGITHAFVWDDVNGIYDLTPSSDKNTKSFSINDTGQVIIADDSNVLIKYER